MPTVSVPVSFLDLYKKSIFGFLTKLNNNDHNNLKTFCKPLHYTFSLPNWKPHELLLFVRLNSPFVPNVFNRIFCKLFVLFFYPVAQQLKNLLWITDVSFPFSLRELEATSSKRAHSCPHWDVIWAPFIVLNLSFGHCSTLQKFLNSHYSAASIFSSLLSTTR